MQTTRETNAVRRAIRDANAYGFGWAYKVVRGIGLRAVADLAAIAREELAIRRTDAATRAAAREAAATNAALKRARKKQVAASK